MPTIASAPQARTVAPSGFAPLDGFAYPNPGNEPYIDEVNGMVAGLYAGTSTGGTFRVTEESSTTNFLGFCWYGNRILDFSPIGPNLGTIPYVALIGVAPSYRGERIPSGERVGDFCLRDALEQIQASSAGGSMPFVWALVAPSNKASHALFDRAGFQINVASAGAGHHFRIRLPGLSV